MDTQLDLSIVATIKDPDLRASLERLGAVIKARRSAQSQSRHHQPRSSSFRSFPKATAGIERHGPECAVSCIQGKDRRFIKDALLATVNGVEIRFTGEQLNQDDHDLLMQLVFMAHKRPIGAWITVPAYAILKALGRKVSGKQYRELRADISRLAAGMVSIRNAKAKIDILVIISSPKPRSTKSAVIGCTGSILS